MSYIRFENGPSKPKTKTWVVWSGDHLLGVVQWFSSWRRYCFFPEIETIFDGYCLAEISSFLENETTKHKEHP